MSRSPHHHLGASFLRLILVPFVKVQILQVADSKAGINMQEFHQENAYETKGLGRLRELADYNAS